MIADEVLARVSAPIAAELRAHDLRKLDEIVKMARDAFPEFAIDDAHWVAYFARHLREGSAKELADLRAADVMLTLACVAGHAAAHTKLDARMRGVSARALAGIRLGRFSVDDVLQNVRVRLLVVAEGEHGPKLATYSGRGPLDGWLRVTIARAALTMLRSRAPDDPDDDPSDAFADLASEDQPQLAALRARCGPELKRAIEDSAAALDPDDRTMLRLHVMDGLTIDDLAAIYKAHRATMARRLARARNAIFEGARSRTMTALGLDEIEFASLMGVMMSRLDLTLARILDDKKS
jgi:RNA polymerase sigma-70 factor (ECF subfamily)